MSALVRLYLYPCQAAAREAFRRDARDLGAYYPALTLYAAESTHQIHIGEEYLNIYRSSSELTPLKGLSYHEVHFARGCSLPDHIRNAILARRAPRPFRR